MALRADRREPAGVSLWGGDSLLCAGVVALLILAAYPVVESGVNDDWSYVRTAQVFARTGHFVYNGWATAVLGWIVPWGALFARIFGGSFTSVRLSVAPIAMACAMLFHGILRRFGLNRAHAIFGALTLALSPLFLAMSSMFMSDVPGVFSVLLCLYLCQRAMEAEDSGKTLMWLLAAAVGGVISGTVRQTSWLTVLVMVPSCGWLLRRRRYVPAVTAVLWVVSAVCIVAVMHWFAKQPYNIPEPLFPRRVSLRGIGHMLNESRRAAPTVLLVCFPALALGLPGLRRPAWRTVLLCVAPPLLVLAVMAAAPRAASIWLPLPPWMGNVLSASGIYPEDGIPGAVAPPIGRLGLFAIEVFLYWCVVGFVRSIGGRRTLPKVEESGSVDSPARWSNLLVLVAPFTLAYVALLLQRAIFTWLFDRYVLPLVAMTLIVLLRLHQDRVSRRVPWVASVLLAVLAAVGVAATHDLFSMYRARVKVAEELQQAGVPRTAIRGGFEFDAITQVEAWGYLNEPRLVNPPHAYVWPKQPAESDPCPYWFAALTPAVQPKYIITRDPGACRKAEFAPVMYRRWLPPWTATMSVELDAR